MRLFGKVDGAIDRYDRAGWFTQPFDLAFKLSVVTPITVRRGPSEADTTIYRGPSADDTLIRCGPSATSDTIRRGPSE